MSARGDDIVAENSTPAARRGPEAWAGIGAFA
jgi:hypothetical protein